ncbi:unnamed protein product [Phytophthora fragariaefolia]|uniref:Unnamed protein product n=1 Tax=Phytophthora fragariaefolia TaxID=1490495 RepID=A0A9W6XUD8_9STRA|nr:unnamed protein product [Phytophthora fragariaefolia]
MAAGLKLVSRKAKRKQEREDKKRQRNKRQRKDSEKAAPERGGKARAPHGKRAAKPQRGGGAITNKFHEFLAEAASAQNGNLLGYTEVKGLRWANVGVTAGEPQSVSAEDKEIKALEAKLGLGSSSSNKAESALKKLKKVVKGQPKAAKVKHSASPGDDGDVESDEDNDSEVDESEGSDAENDFGDEMEMDEETRREMELLQAEDAEFLKGMDELPTDESESESDTDLAQFYSDEEDEDDDEARANTLRNQQLPSATDEEEEVSGDSDGEAEQEEDNSDDDDDTLDVEEESDEDVTQESNKNGDDGEEEEKESVVVEEDIYGRPIIKTSDGSKKPSAYLPPHLRRKLEAEAKAAAAAAATEKVKPSQMDEQAMRELTRRINGQLNRISESNMEYVTALPSIFSTPVLLIMFAL